MREADIVYWAFNGAGGHTALFSELLEAAVNAVFVFFFFFYVAVFDGPIHSKEVNIRGEKKAETKLSLHHSFRIDEYLKAFRGLACIFNTEIVMMVYIAAKMSCEFCSGHQPRRESAALKFCTGSWPGLWVMSGRFDSAWVNANSASHSQTRKRRFTSAAEYATGAE